MLHGSDQPDMPPAVDRLPVEQLAQVLQHVPLKERLSSCALVHSSWRTAAAEATTEIECDYDSKSLSAWLRPHCEKVHVTRVFIKYSGRRSGLRPLRLPVIHLQYLQQLRLACIPWESATVSAGQQPPRKRRRLQAAWPSLASLTALTSLLICGASVRLDGLEALTGLKELSMSGRGEAVNDNVTSIPNFNSAEALLAAALPKLQHLTRLDLGFEIRSSTALAQISTMQGLEQLVLESRSLDSLPVMPQSLTQLHMNCALVFTGSNAQHFSHRPSGADPDKPHIRPGHHMLEGMTRLRQINLFVGELVASNRQPLLVFRGLTALQSLQLTCVMRQPVALMPAEAAALTSSSHLTHLDLGRLLGNTDSGHSLQEAHYEAMFPAGRQLQLRELRADTALLSSTVDLGQLTGLTSVAVQLHSHEMQWLAAGLKKLTASKNLAKLELCASVVDLPAGVWSSLAALTGMGDLTVECAPPSGLHLLALTSCQRLEKLSIPAKLPIGNSFLSVVKFQPGYYEDLGVQLQVGICCVGPWHTLWCKPLNAGTHGKFVER